MGTSARQQKETISSLEDPFARNSLRTAYHFRKYALLYVCGILGALALAIFPAVRGGGGNGIPALSASGGSGSGGAGSSGASGASAGSADGGTVAGGALAGADSGASVGSAGSAGATGAAAGGGSAGAGGGGVAGGPAGGGPASAGGGPVGTVQAGTGVTRGGVPCHAGVRQIPFSTYAAACEAKFTGGNGGVTAAGVNATTINMAVRETSDATSANGEALQAEGEAAGGVSNDTSYSYMQAIVKYLNSQFELYGRQVKLDKFNGQGNATNEALGTGQAPACADTDTVANTIHAFGDFDYVGIFESGVFSDCAARYHIYIPEGAPYYPDSFYAQHAPYVWGITMNCTLISQEVAEWVGKQIAPYPTKWAGNDGITNLNGKQRKFGVYVPNNAGYQECTTASRNIEENQYHIASNREDQYNYALNIATFPQDAQKAIIQFAANNDTTVVLACDPISPIFLTQDAVQQNYTPEWALIGVAGTDTDNYGQLWSAKAITGHLFGLSQLASTQEVLSPGAEAGKALAAAGVTLNITSATDYYELLSMFNQLQAAGPDLTVANIAAGTRKIPAGTGAFGTWNFGSTHTAITDSRQIYWNAGGKSPANNKTGTYVQIYNGKRFGLGGFPTGEPGYFQ